MFEESKGGAADHHGTSTNPFRMLNKKDKESSLQAVGMSNLDVKRVKYSYKQTSPTGEDKMFSAEHHHYQDQYYSTGASTTKEVRGSAGAAAGQTTSPFQPSASGTSNNGGGGKESLR